MAPASLEEMPSGQEKQPLQILERRPSRSWQARVRKKPVAARSLRPGQPWASVREKSAVRSVSVPRRSAAVRH